MHKSSCAIAPFDTAQDRLSPLKKEGLRGICSTWRPPSERAAGEETGNHCHTETLPPCDPS